MGQANVNLLLDTHALIWWWTDDAHLSKRVRKLLLDTENTVYVSAASAWEIAIKQRIGKLEGVPYASEQFASLVDADGFVHLPMRYAHALRAGAYASAHRDPFDRMLAAQSEIEGISLVTRDPLLKEMGCKTIW